MTNSEKIIANNEKIASITEFLENNSIDQILNITENGIYKTKRAKQVNVNIRNINSDAPTKEINWMFIKSANLLSYMQGKEKSLLTDGEADLINDWFSYWSKIHLGE